ncbi:hypothetical protein WAK64_22265 [Bacillus spongiae]|uniref:ABC transporter permease n=1 Tax=Bacillus spongiae TaxID=2683610 RepID=A0ABU8HKY3_9BACI
MKNKDLVVNILRKKTHHFLTISLIVMVVSLSMFNFIFAYLADQYRSINKDYFNNSNVKVIHVEGKAEGSSSVGVQLQDENDINDLLLENGLSDKAKAYPIYILPTIFDDSLEKGYSMLGLSEELAFLVGDTCTLKDDSICIKETVEDHIDFKIPIIEEKDGGFSSNEVVDKRFIADEGAKNENAILIQSIPNNNQAYVNDKEAIKLLKTMYKDSSDSFEFIQQSQLDKMIVYVKDIKDVDSVGELLKKHQYYTSYTFSSFENFSVNIGSKQVILMILSIVFVITSIITAVLLMINFLRIQRKEIAILKLNGYDKKSIVKVYTKLQYNIFKLIFIITLLIYLIVYLLKLVPISIDLFLLIIGIDILVLLISLSFVYVLGIKKTSNMDMMELLKKDKEFD